ncbi:MAG: histidine--tRNA ligase [Oscillospiraceae bacterium]|nr:histidine--tRNA ligase [Oscillospiraceae bacterium]
MPQVKPRTLSGFMELLPAPQQQLERMLNVLRETYALYGFTPLDTPLLESAEVLLAKGGGETEKQIYRFQKGDSDLALRFDLTVPLAKYVAQHYGELSFPFRRYQIGKVYRGERAQRGRFREFYQADIDIIGDGKLSILNEAEIPAIIYQTFSRLGLKRFQIRVNNRKILNGFYAMLHLEGYASDIMRIVDKLDKVGQDKLGLMLAEEPYINEDAAGEILEFILIRGSNAEVLARLEDYRGQNALFDEGLDELRAVTEHLAAFGVPEENFAVDLTIARGLDYYTGTVYETALLDHPEIGSVCSGGRYDNLAGYYIDKPLPGVGISIGVTRLFYVLGEQGLLNPALPTAPADVLVLPMTEDLAPAVRLATELRAAGVRTQLYTEQKKFKAKMAYADKLAIPYALFLGEDELAGNVVACKDMTTGVQTTLSVPETISLIRAGLREKNRGAIILEQSNKGE